VEYTLKVLQKALKDKFRRNMGWSCKELGLCKYFYHVTDLVLFDYIR